MLVWFLFGNSDINQPTRAAFNPSQHLHCSFVVLHSTTLRYFFGNLYSTHQDEIKWFERRKLVSCYNKNILSNSFSIHFKSELVSYSHLENSELLHSCITWFILFHNHENLLRCRRITIQILIRNFDILTSLCQIVITRMTNRITLIVSLSKLNAENLSRTQFQCNWLNTDTTIEIKKLY